MGCFGPLIREFTRVFLKNKTGEEEEERK